MIVEEIRRSILQSASRGELTLQNNEFSALKELSFILEDKKENKKYVYKNIETKPFDIPENWTWVKIEDVALKVTDGTHSTPKYTTSGIPFLSVKDLSSGIINFDNTKFISKEEHDNLYKRCNPEYGDILITKVGTTGVPVIVDNNEEFSLFVSVALIKFNHEKVYNKFLYYILSSPVVQAQVVENTRGVGNKNWVLNSINNTIFPLPPLEEQKRIVKKIEKLFNKLNEVKPIENELNLIKNSFVNNMKESILKTAFDGTLTSQKSSDQSLFELENNKSIIDDNIPTNWKRFKFVDIFNIINGFTPLRTNNEFWDKKEINWFTVEDIRKQGRIITNTEQYISKKALGKSLNRIIEKDSVLLCCTASVGEYALTKIPLTTNQQFNGIVIKDEFKKFIMPEYLFHYVSTLKNKLYSSSGKTTFAFLSTKKLGQFTIPIPPIDEQKRIVEKLECLLTACNDLEFLLKF